MLPVTDLLWIYYHFMFSLIAFMFCYLDLGLIHQI